MNIWIFAPEKIVFAILAAQAVYSIATRMQLGILRFYKDLLHPLLSTLKMPLSVENKDVLQLYVETAKSIRLLVKIGKPCLARWRGLIVSGISKCWLGISDTSGKEELEKELREVVKELRIALGSSLEVSTN